MREGDWTIEYGKSVGENSDLWGQKMVGPASQFLNSEVQCDSLSVGW